jgi:hypothetical protein
MPNRAWFYASQDNRQISCSEDELRGLIAAGAVTADTFVWSEGMTDWQKAGEIPDLRPSLSSPPAFPGSAGPLAIGAGAGTPIHAEFSIWAMLGRALLYLIGIVLVIPAPWAATAFYRWFIPHLQVSQRPNLGFTGNPGDIWYVHMLLALIAYAGLANVDYLVYVLIPVQGFLSWMVLRWVVANISSNGRRLPLRFTGESWKYVGWYLLLYISFITIVGWAWVTTAWMRWNCANIAGARRPVVFVASGWEVLWRTLVFTVLCALIIPLPWALGWYARWYMSQFELVEGAA